MGKQRVSECGEREGMQTKEEDGNWGRKAQGALVVFIGCAAG